jgi:hypothetical protein
MSNCCELVEGFDCWFTKATVVHTKPGVSRILFLTVKRIQNNFILFCFQGPWVPLEVLLPQRGERVKRCGNPQRPKGGQLPIHMGVHRKSGVSRTFFLTVKWIHNNFILFCFQDPPTINSSCCSSAIAHMVCHLRGR